MKTIKSLGTLTLCVLSAFGTSVVLNTQQAKANDYSENLCRQAVVGTYLATANQTNSTSGQPSSYRELITFTGDGNVIANDSTAGGVPGSSAPALQPFGTVQGIWKCTGNNQILVKAPNFTFASGSLPANIALSNYSLRFNPQTGTVNGNLTYNFYDLNSNPLNQNTQPLPGGPYQFSYHGVKLKAD